LKTFDWKEANPMLNGVTSLLHLILKESTECSDHSGARFLIGFPVRDSRVTSLEMKNSPKIYVKERNPVHFCCHS